jgi:hypothetical protein
MIALRQLVLSEDNTHCGKRSGIMPLKNVVQTVSVANVGDKAKAIRPMKITAGTATTIS